MLDATQIEGLCLLFCKWFLKIQLKLLAFQHDITITGLFGAIDMEYFDGDRDALPEFSSLLLIELLRRVDTGEFVVKVLFRIVKNMKFFI
jgi:hypothetical protein